MKFSCAVKVMVLLRRKKINKRMVLAIIAAILAGCGGLPPRESALDRVDTIVVIYAENHSFDNLYGMFPGANGVANATAEQKAQLDHGGRILRQLPPVYTSEKPDPRYPRDLPNVPFRIDAPPVNGRI